MSSPSSKKVMSPELKQEIADGIKSFNVDSQYFKAIEMIVTEAKRDIKDIIKDILPNTTDAELINMTHPDNLPNLFSVKPRSESYNMELIKTIVNKLYINGSDARSTKNGSPDKLCKEISSSNLGITTLGLFSALDNNVKELISCPKRVKITDINKINQKIKKTGNKQIVPTEENKNLYAFSNPIFHRYICYIILKGVLLMNNLPEDTKDLSKSKNNLCYVTISNSALTYIISTLEGDTTWIKKSTLDNVFNPRIIFDSQERAKVIGK